MTKQEQIEEMSKYICNVCEMGFSFNGDCSEGGQDYYKRCTLTQETAKALYDAGYHKTSDEFEKEVNRQEQIEEIEEVLINKNKYTGKDCTDCDHWFGSFCGAPIKCQAEAIYEAGYRNSPDKKIVFIDVSEPKKERIIPEGEPIKDIGAEGALGKEGKTSCDVGEYKSRFEIADKVLTETRAKLAKAEHDRDRYKAEIKRLKRIVEQKVKQVEVEE